MASITNFMKGSSDIIGSSYEILNAELFIPEESVLNCEIELAPNRFNRTSGKVEIVPYTYPIEKILSDNDTYITSKNKYYNFCKATSLKQGTYEKEEYQSFIKFDQLINVNKDTIGKFIVKDTLILKPITKYTGKISIYECTTDFSENNVSWFSHPEKGNLIATVDCVDSGVIKIDLSLYTKNIILRKAVHKGFYLETDHFLNIYSSNTNITEYRPRIEVQYYDPNRFTTTHILNSEIPFKYVDILNAELDLQLPFPVLDCELIYSQDSLNCELYERNSSKSELEAEIKFAVQEENALMGEIIYSQDGINSEIKFASVSVLPSEVYLFKTEEEIIECELPFTQDFIQATIPLKFIVKSELEAEILYKERGSSLLNSELFLKSVGNEVPLNCELYHLITGNEDEFEAEMILALNSTGNESILPCELELDDGPFEKILDAELDLIIKKEKALDSEIIFKSTNNESIINCQFDLIFIESKELDSELDLMFGKAIDSELYLKLQDRSELNSELYYKVTNNENYLDAELTFIKQEESKLNSELTLIIKEESKLESELNLIFTDENKLESELNLIFTDKKALDSELQLLFSNSLESELNLKFSDESKLDAEINLAFRTEDKIDTELQLLFSKALDCEASFVFQDTKALDCSLKLVFQDKQPIDAELNLLFGKAIPAKFNLLFSKELDSEINLAFADKSELESEVIFKSTNNEKVLFAELMLNYPVFEDSLDSELTLIFNDKNELDTELQLLFNSKLESELSLIFNDKLDSEINLAFADKSELDAEINLEFRTEKELDTELNLIFNNSIESEINLAFADKSELESEVIFKSTNNELILPAEINLFFDGYAFLNCELQLRLKKKMRSYMYSVQL